MRKKTKQKFQRSVYLLATEYKSLAAAAKKERLSFSAYMLKAAFEKFERENQVNNNDNKVGA